MRKSNRFETSPRSQLNSVSGQSPISVYMENAILTQTGVKLNSAFQIGLKFHPALKTSCKRKLVSNRFEIKWSRVQSSHWHCFSWRQTDDDEHSLHS